MIQKRIISLGAGTQSSYLYIASCIGLIPKADAAIFADTQAELSEVYTWLKKLEKKFGHIIPIHRASRGSLIDNFDLATIAGTRAPSIPFWVRKKNGKPKPLKRICTMEYKIEVVQKKTRELCGLKYRQRAKGKIQIEMMIGISTDEIHRMKPAKRAWIKNAYPLVDLLNVSRNDCVKAIQDMGLGTPPWSSCVECPFHDNAKWRHIQNVSPQDFERACQFDERHRVGGAFGDKEKFLHPSMIPLRSADISKDDVDYFGNECEGVCGV